MQQSIPEGKPTEAAQGTSQTHLVNYLLFPWTARSENKSPSSTPQPQPRETAGGLYFLKKSLGQVLQASLFIRLSFVLRPSCYCTINSA